ncbi:MAG: hypothetical protein LBN71_04195 [Tannerella sp.]|jgi:hypothetical protein|nr:hypothetical protein [Tannerella sp.]
MGKEHNLKNLVSAVVVGVLLSATVLTACGNGDDDAPSELSEEQNDIVQINITSMTDINNNMIKIENAATNPTQSANVKFTQNVKINMIKSDLKTLDKLFLIPGNISINTNGAVVIPAEDIVLSDAECGILVKLWNKGLKFSQSVSKLSIFPEQKSYFTAEMLQNLTIVNSSEIVVTNVDEFLAKTEQAKQAAAKNPITFVLDAKNELNMPAEYLTEFYKLDNQNIRVVQTPGTVINALATKNPTPESALNPLYNFRGTVRINLLISENAKAPGGINAVIASDSSFYAGFSTESVNIENAVFTVLDAKTKKPINPVFARYAYQSQYTSTIAPQIDVGNHGLIDPQYDAGSDVPQHITEVQVGDGHHNETRSLEHLYHSFMTANHRGSLSFTNLTPPYNDFNFSPRFIPIGITGPVTFNISTDPKYKRTVPHPTKGNFTGICIAGEDFAYTTIYVLNVKTKLRPDNYIFGVSNNYMGIFTFDPKHQMNITDPDVIDENVRTVTLDKLQVDSSGSYFHPISENLRATFYEPVIRLFPKIAR